MPTHAVPDLEPLLSAARAGDRDAQGRLLDQCRAYLLYVANEKLDSRLQARGGGSDLVQETILNALIAFPEFRGSTLEELHGWLRAILLNVIADFRRHHLADKRNPRAEESLDDPDSRNDLLDKLVHDSPPPDGKAILRERLEALRNALARLPGEYREVLQLRHERKQSFDQIGAALGRSPDAARMLHARAVKQLSKIMRVDS